MNVDLILQIDVVVLILSFLYFRFTNLPSKVKRFLFCIHILSAFVLFFIIIVKTWKV